MAGLMFFGSDIHLHATISDRRFLDFLAEYPEEQEQPCKACGGCGWVDCPECGPGPDWDRDDECNECGTRRAVHCNACANTGLAVWSWWFNAHTAERIAIAYWNRLVAGVNNNPPMPGVIYRQQKSPVSSMAVVAADSQVELGHSSETGS